MRPRRMPRWATYLRYVAGKWPVRSALLLGAVVAAGTVPVLLSLATGDLVAAVPAAHGHGAASAAGHRLVHRLVVFAILLLCLVVLSPLQLEWLGGLRSRINRDVRVRLLNASLLPRGVGHLENQALLDQVEQTRRGAAGFNASTALAGLTQQAGMWVSLVGATVLLASYRWWLPIPPLVAMVVVRRVMRRRIFAMVDVTLQGTTEIRRAGYFSDLALGASATKEVRVFGLAGWVAEQFDGAWRRAMVPIWQARAGGAWQAAAAMAAGFVIELAPILWLVSRAVDGRLGIGRLTVLLGAAGVVHHAITFVSEAARIAYGLAAYESIIEIERLAIGAAEQVTGDQQYAGPPREEIRFEGVSFRYPGGEREVFRGLDLSVRAGERLAVVGLNGAGKTTLVKLLARLYEPTGGRITVDGQPLTQLRPEDWQRQVAAVFQDFTRYPLTAEENVRIGAPTADLPEASLARALDQARAAQIVAELPAGASTLLDRMFAGGIELSGGQWQRVALARAFYAVAAGASILILDEPTSSLDVRAEADFYDRFLDLTAGVTTIVISHRFGTVRRADRIAVVEDGAVVELGSHDELVAAGGRYASLFQLQSSRYAEEAGGV